MKSTINNKMKNLKISKEAHKQLSKYKVEWEKKKLSDVIEKILEEYKEFKGA